MISKRNNSGLSGVVRNVSTAAKHLTGRKINSRKEFYRQINMVPDDLDEPSCRDKGLLFMLRGRASNERTSGTTILKGSTVTR